MQSLFKGFNLFIHSNLNILTICFTVVAGVSFLVHEKVIQSVKLHLGCHFRLTQTANVFSSQQGEQQYCT